MILVDIDITYEKSNFLKWPKNHFHYELFLLCTIETFWGFEEVEV